jgi:uncharacterized protein YndB with AHSA1/START domain
LSVKLPEKEAIMGHLKDTILIDAPVDKVWSFAHDPHHWPRFMVGMSDPDRIAGSGGVGSEVDFTILMAGVHLHETVHSVEDREEPGGGYHWRADITGPSSGWMTWDYVPQAGGTEIDLEWEYSLPGSVLGKIADRLVVEKMQARDMHNSLENLKSVVEATLH